VARLSAKGFRNVVKNRYLSMNARHQAVALVVERREDTVSTKE
jgi:hypothetical protein